MNKKLSKNKKILLGSLGLVALAGISSVIVVSCSANKSPALQQSVTYSFANTKLNFNGNSLYCSTGDINGFKSNPGIDKKNKITYDASNKFYVLQNFSQWIYPMVSQFSYVFSTWFLGNIDTIASNLPTEQKQLAVALATPLNQSNDTIRYGLQTIEFTEPSWPLFSSYVDGTNTNNISVSFSGIKLTYNWWSTSDGSNVIWKDSSFNPETQLASSPNWSKWIEKAIKPPRGSTTISFDQTITLDLKPQVLDNKTTGIFEVDASNDSIVGFASNSAAAKKQAKDFYNTLEYAYKVSHGDINNVEFSSYYQDNKESINRILRSFSIKI